jgi:signal transduction histidine kinase
MKPAHTAALRRLADQVLEAPELDALTRLLTRSLPAILGLREATLLIWDRKLDTFFSLTPGQTHVKPVRPEEARTAPETRYLLADGQVLETPGRGDGLLVPLMARSGLAGMLALGPRPGRRKTPYRPVEARLLSVLATRSALAIENHVYQKELIDSERMAAVGTMAGMLAHDFRGPMTVIRGYAETLLEPGLPAEEIRLRAELIMKNVDRLERMTEETLDFARGGGELAPRVVSVPSLLEEIAADLARELPGLEVVPRFEAPPGAMGAFDLDKLRRALGNIAANARDAMGGRGRLHFAACVQNGRDHQGRERPELALTLSDEGPGVDEDLRGRLFEPFVTRGKKGGTGLGLAVARRFIEHHGGTVELLADGPGAHFRITIPLDRRSAPRPAHGRASPWV